MRKVVVMVTGCVLAAGCSDESTTAPVPCTAETTSVAVQVQRGDPVTFDWSPACDMALVLIEPENSGGDVWGLHTDDENGIMPPVRFGEEREGARTVHGSGTLIPGTTYEVILWRITDEGERLMAIHAFTP